jgi:L-threonylcarbamoyladenylate synthase
MILSALDRKNIALAAEMIKAGKLVAFPTETVYGLGADALNQIAITQIFEAKNRPTFDPLIVHIPSYEWWYRICKDISPIAQTLAEHLWPGPLTIVLKKQTIVPDIVTSGLDTVAVRMPAHPAAIDLLQVASRPIAAPSANPFGFLSPTTAIHVEEQLGTKIEIILDGGPCRVGIESTIIDLSGRPSLLRPGGIAKEEIERITGPLEAPGESERLSDSPGRLKSHYAPRSRLIILPEQLKTPKDPNAAYLFFTPPDADYPNLNYEVLTQNGDLREAATNLFSALHRLDEAGCGTIYAEPVPEHSLGLAIMDRLKKASAAGILR